MGINENEFIHELYGDEWGESCFFFFDDNNVCVLLLLKKKMVTCNM